MPKPGSKGHGKSGHLSKRLRQKAPQRYFTFTFTPRTVFLGQNKKTRNITETLDYIKKAESRTKRKNTRIPRFGLNFTIALKKIGFLAIKFFDS